MAPRLLNSADYHQSSSPLFSLTRPGGGSGAGGGGGVVCVQCVRCFYCSLLITLTVFVGPVAPCFCLYNIHDSEQSPQKIYQPSFSLTLPWEDLSVILNSLWQNYLQRTMEFFSSSLQTRHAHVLCVVGDVKDCSSLSLKSDQNASLASF